MVEIEISTTSPQEVNANLKSDFFMNYKESSSYLTKNNVSIKRTNRLILYGETIGVSCETRTKYINTLRETMQFTVATVVSTHS